jgi:hypothetical protein
VPVDYGNVDWFERPDGLESEGAVGMSVGDEVRVVRRDAGSVAVG